MVECFGGDYRDYRSPALKLMNGGATKGRDDFIRDAVEAFVRNRHEAIMPASEFEGLLRDAFTLLDKDNPVADASSASSGDAE